MSKLKFRFQVKATTDGKSNFIAITSLTTEDERTFVIPDEYQSSTLHEEMCKTDHFTRIKNTLKKRHAIRNVWITLNESLINTYLDQDNNLMFKNVYLEEQITNTEQQLNVPQTLRNENDPVVKVLEALVQNQQQTRKQNVKKAAERFVLEKFSGKSSNTLQWIEFFESECNRFDITEDKEKIEVFRLFLEKSCLDWYNSMMLKLTLDSEWVVWKQNFCQTYANKGWSASRYALEYKYQAGSLLDYAVKKEKLMLEVRKTIDQGTLIDIIAAGIPTFIMDKINKEEIAETQDLFNEIGKLEHLVKNKTSTKKSNQKVTIETKQKCSICEKLQKGVRYHPESSCWFRTKEKADPGNQIKLVNNSQLECELQDQNQKNF